LTSLPNGPLFPLPELKEHYTRPWFLATGYTHFKCRIEIKKFSRKSSLPRFQDYHVGALTTNLTDMIVNQLQNLILDQTKKQTERLRYLINLPYEASSMKNNIELHFIRGNIPKCI